MKPNSKDPCVIIDSHHPKHFLAVRRLGQLCLDRGIRTIWTMQDKDVLVDLVRQNGFEPLVLAKAQKSLIRKLGELAVYDWRLAGVALRERPLALIGKTVSLAHVGWLFGIPSLIINDDSAAANPQYRYLAYPFASRVITAECLNEDYGEKQRTYAGLMELAYLHPNVFSPDASIRNELGVGPEERLFLIRLAAFDAYHDVGGRGLSRDLVDRVIRRLEPEGRVFIVSEAPLPVALAERRLPVAAARLHHVIAACDMVLGDGLTVCVEAALLGVPAIAFGSYIGKHTYSEIIEKRFGLMFGFTPDRASEFFACIEELISRPNLKEEWRRRQEVMLREWGDPTEVYWEELCAAIDPALEGCPA